LKVNYAFLFFELAGAGRGGIDVAQIKQRQPARAASAFLYNASRPSLTSVDSLLLAAPHAFGGLDALIVLPVFGLAIVFTLLWNEWAKSILNRFIEDRNWTLLSARYCWIARGPFTWRSSKNQVVFRIEVQDRRGEVHNGYACVGGYFFGLLDPKVSIEWTGGSLGPTPF
jgi:hypothetical protein